MPEKKYRDYNSERGYNYPKGDVFRAVGFKERSPLKKKREDDKAYRTPGAYLSVIAAFSDLNGSY